MIVDALGNPVKFLFTGGNVHDSKVAVPVLEQIDINGSIVMADKAYGAKSIRDYIIEQGATYTIPPKTNNPEPWDCDWFQYKERHLVECFFTRLKHFRRVATRYDKLIERFSSFDFRIRPSCDKSEYTSIIPIFARSNFQNRHRH